MDDRGVDLLIGELFQSSVKDYRLLLEGKKVPKPDCNIQELETFFRSEWFDVLIDHKYKGEDVIKEIRKQVKNGK